jgi:hypothetical protein
MEKKDSLQITPEDLMAEIMAPIGTDVYHYIIPKDQNKIYNIDLNTRTIEVPQFLSVTEDHNSSVIWFKVDRFYDDIDLYGASCWIQYKNSLKQEFICTTIPKPFAHDSHDALYIPWPISRAATEGSGTVEFSIRFFKLSENVEETTDENGESKELRKVIYSLNTKPAKGKILDTLQVGPYSGFFNSDIDENKFLPQRKELI